MKPEAIREQERRLAALTYEQSPCRTFHVEPQAEGSEARIELIPGPNGEDFLTYWLHAEARRRLQAVGLTELEPGVWTIALDFGDNQWAAYTLRAMARSSWSGCVFPLAEMGKTWPEGVVLEPDEAEHALGMESDLTGIVLPAGEDWLVLAFIANDYGDLELRQLADRLLTDEYQRVAYLQENSPLTGLPRPAFLQQYPKAVPLEPIQFLPPREGIELDPDADPSERLFKEHWILRLLNPPEKESDHAPE